MQPLNRNDYDVSSINCMECVFGGAMIKLSPNPAIHVCFGGWACIRSLVQAEMKQNYCLWRVMLGEVAVWTLLVLTLIWNWLFQLGGCHYPAERKVVGAWSSPRFRFFIMELIWTSEAPRDIPHFHLSCRVLELATHHLSLADTSTCCWEGHAHRWYSQEMLPSCLAHTIVELQLHANRVVASKFVRQNASTGTYELALLLQR